MAILAGCAGEAPLETFQVSGKVLYLGRPLTNGSLTFSAPNLPLYFAAISPSGGYETRLPAGRFAVSVASPSEMPAGMKPMEEFAHVPKGMQLPTRYGDVQTSPLTIEVAPGEPNMRDFALTR
ncbi:MAG: hypothetical protein KF847_17590 [Pirellulales bacterium]|nr:hypothetical protein [Pirellulales bacterium]